MILFIVFVASVAFISFSPRYKILLACTMTEGASEAFYIESCRGPTEKEQSDLEIIMTSVNFRYQVFV